MIVFEKNYSLQPEDDTRDWTIEQANGMLNAPNVFLTDFIAPLSPGDRHDYYSNGDYWWPNPDKPDGLPYIQLDGQSNPNNFMEHRNALRRMRTMVSHLSMAFHYTGRGAYARRACELLKGFFVDEKTNMAPHLSYAQAIPGLCDGRGIGIIDTLHLTEVPFAIDKLRTSGVMEDELYLSLKEWFARYLDWMLTHPNGKDERNTTNNHAVCFYVQAASFARFTDNTVVLDACRKAFKGRLINQMASDGSFPREIGRTKPYNYSLFVMDNMVTLCQLLSGSGDDLWHYKREDDRGITDGLDFIIPYVMDKGKWPFGEDVEHFESWPVRQSFLLFSGMVLGKQEYLDCYYSLPVQSADKEIRRNVALRQPLLLL